MKSDHIGFLIAHLKEINEKGDTHTPHPTHARAITAALNELGIPFRRTVYPSGYTITLKED